MAEWSKAVDLSRLYSYDLDNSTGEIRARYVFVSSTALSTVQVADSVSSSNRVRSNLSFCSSLLRTPLGAERAATGRVCRLFVPLHGWSMPGLCLGVILSRQSQSVFIVFDEQSIRFSNTLHSEHYSNQPPPGSWRGVNSGVLYSTQVEGSLRPPDECLYTHLL